MKHTLQIRTTYILRMLTYVNLWFFDQYSKFNFAWIIFNLLNFCQLSGHRFSIGLDSSLL